MPPSHSDSHSTHPTTGKKPKLKIPGFNASGYGRPVPALAPVSDSSTDCHTAEKTEKSTQKVDFQGRQSTTRPDNSFEVRERKRFVLTMSPRGDSNAQDNDLGLPDRNPSVNQHSILSHRKMVANHHKAAGILPEPAPPSSNKPMDRGRREILQILQQNNLREIQDRNRRKGDPVVPETTSLGDLELARRPFEMSEPQKPSKGDKSTGAAQEHDVVYSAKSASQNSEGGADQCSRDIPSKTLITSPQTPHERETNIDHLSTIEFDLVQKPNELTRKEDQPYDQQTSSTSSRNHSLVSPSKTADNAWQSDLERNASSNRVEDYKPQLQNGDRVDESIMAWDGTMIPPRADWHDRTKFNYESNEYANHLNSWTGENLALAHPNLSDGVFMPVPSSALNDTENIPDGLGMVPRGHFISAENAKRYGYEIEPESVTKYARATPEENFISVDRVNPHDPQNVSILNGETTEQLVENWKRHKQRQIKPASICPPAPLRRATLSNYVPPPNPNTPLLNIYLRPAIRGDIPQLTAIYNWYIENGPRTAETRVIDESDMRFRFDEARSGLFPFIVAVERGKMSSGRDRASSNAPTSSRNDQYQIKPRANEKVVGWACAMDFTASDFAERISAEVEVYVEAHSRRKGVGNCLLDKLLDACDRGHNAKGGYPFHCAPEIAHLYSAGGGRDLHKLLFLVRKWRFPSKLRLTAQKSSKGKETIDNRIDDREDDFDAWLKAWLDKWGFEQEGYLTGIGAKQNRFIDIAYMSLETKWQPREGELYEPTPGFCGTRVRS